MVVFPPPGLWWPQFGDRPYIVVLRANHLIFSRQPCRSPLARGAVKEWHYSHTLVLLRA